MAQRQTNCKHMYHTTSY